MSSRKLIKSLRQRYYRSTAALRARPDFVVIGAMKCGTSTLFERLRQHPQIVPSHRKEVHFFDRHYDSGERWYRAQFPYTWNVPQGAISGEASPFYLLCPPIAGRIHAFNPNMRLIALLRDPVERAISHYFHALRSGKETLPIMEALDAEQERTADAWQRALQGQCSYDRELIWFSYQRRGLYLEQLQRYWQVFDPQQLYIESSDRLFSDPAACLADIFDFLGVDAGFRVPVQKSRGIATNKETLPDAVYERLRDYFREPNARLFSALDSDLGWNNT